MFSEGLAKFQSGGKYGYIDKSGKVVIEPQYQIASDFSEGIASVRIDDGSRFGKWRYIDKTGKTVIDNPAFQDANSFNEGLARVAIKGKWHFINKTGQIVINRDFILAGNFSEGRAMVWLPRILSFYPRMCYIDRTGKIVLDNLKFNSIGQFSEGLATVETLSGGMKILAL